MQRSPRTASSRSSLQTLRAKAVQIGDWDLARSEAAWRRVRSSMSSFFSFSASSSTSGSPARTAWPSARFIVWIRPLTAAFSGLAAAAASTRAASLDTWIVTVARKNQTNQAQDGRRDDDDGDAPPGTVDLERPEGLGKRKGHWCTERTGNPSAASLLPGVHGRLRGGERGPRGLRAPGCAKSCRGASRKIAGERTQSVGTSVRNGHGPGTSAVTMPSRGTTPAPARLRSASRRLGNVLEVIVASQRTRNRPRSVQSKRRGSALSSRRRWSIRRRVSRLSL